MWLHAACTAAGSGAAGSGNHARLASINHARLALIWHARLLSLWHARFAVPAVPLPGFRAHMHTRAKKIEHVTCTSFRHLARAQVLGWATGVNTRHIVSRDTVSGDSPPLITPKPLHQDCLAEQHPSAHEPWDTQAEAPWARGAGGGAATDGASARGVLVPSQTSARRPSLQSVRVSCPPSCLGCMPSRWRKYIACAHCHTHRRPTRLLSTRLFSRTRCPSLHH